MFEQIIEILLPKTRYKNHSISSCTFSISVSNFENFLALNYNLNGQNFTKYAVRKKKIAPKEK